MSPTRATRAMSVLQVFNQKNFDGIDSIDVFLEGLSLIVLDKYNGSDPELNPFFVRMTDFVAMHKNLVGEEPIDFFERISLRDGLQRLFLRRHQSADFFSSIDITHIVNFVAAIVRSGDSVRWRSATSARLGVATLPESIVWRMWIETLMVDCVSVSFHYADAFSRLGKWCSINNRYEFMSRWKYCTRANDANDANDGNEDDQLEDDQFQEMSELLSMINSIQFFAKYGDQWKQLSLSIATHKSFLETFGSMSLSPVFNQAISFEFLSSISPFGTFGTSNVLPYRVCLLHQFCKLVVPDAMSVLCGAWDSLLSESTNVADGANAPLGVFCGWIKDKWSVCHQVDEIDRIAVHRLCQMMHERRSCETETMPHLSQLLQLQCVHILREVQSNKDTNDANPVDMETFFLQLCKYVCLYHLSDVRLHATIDRCLTQFCATLNRSDFNAIAHHLNSVCSLHSLHTSPTLVDRCEIVSRLLRHCDHSLTAVFFERYKFYLKQRLLCVFQCVEGTGAGTGGNSDGVSGVSSDSCASVHGTTRSTNWCALERLWIDAFRGHDRALLFPLYQILDAIKESARFCAQIPPIPLSLDLHVVASNRVSSDQSDQSDRSQVNLSVLICGPAWNIRVPRLHAVHTVDPCVDKVFATVAARYKAVYPNRTLQFCNHLTRVIVRVESVENVESVNHTTHMTLNVNLVQFAYLRALWQNTAASRKEMHVLKKRFPRLIAWLPKAAIEILSCETLDAASEIGEQDVHFNCVDATRQQLTCRFNEMRQTHSFIRSEKLFLCACNVLQASHATNSMNTMRVSALWSRIAEKCGATSVAERDNVMLALLSERIVTLCEQNQTVTYLCAENARDAHMSG